MCEPISASTAAYIMIGTTVAGTAVSMIGQANAAKAGQQQAQYEATVAQNNQKIADQNAQDAINRGVIAEQQQRQQVRNVIGTERAELGGSGGALDSDSNVNTVADTAQFGELDALTVRNNAEREAYGYKTQGMNFGAQSGLDISRSSQIASALPFQLGGTLLGGATQVGSIYMRQNRGMYPMYGYDGYTP